jgi:hypothetical protein
MASTKLLQAALAFESPDQPMPGSDGPSGSAETEYERPAQQYRPSACLKSICVLRQSIPIEFNRT